MKQFDDSVSETIAKSRSEIGKKEANSVVMESIIRNTPYLVKSLTLAITENKEQVIKL